MKRQSSEWEDMFANDTSDKGLIFKIYKKTYTTQHTHKKQSNLKTDNGPE